MLFRRILKFPSTDIDNFQAVDFSSCRLLLHPPSLLTTSREGCSVKRRGVGRQLWAVAYTGSPVGQHQYGSESSHKLGKRIPLSSAELHKAALLARLSGLCYYPPEQLADRLQKEGMRLVTNGGTSFTRYAVRFS